MLHINATIKTELQWKNSWLLICIFNSPFILLEVENLHQEAIGVIILITWESLMKYAF